MEGRMLHPKNNDRKGNGGKRAWSGRKKGVLNKVQLDLRKATREFTETALETLVAIATDKDWPPAAPASSARLTDEPSFRGCEGGACVVQFGLRRLLGIREELCTIRLAAR